MNHPPGSRMVYIPGRTLLPSEVAGSEVTPVLGPSVRSHGRDFTPFVGPQASHETSTWRSCAGLDLLQTICETGIIYYTVREMLVQCISSPIECSIFLSGGG